MLDRDTISQLSHLKKAIRSNLNVQQGTVRGKAGRYGFVTLDDGRDSFLPPEQMQRVLHGDRVEVLVTENNQKKLEAKLQKLLFSPQKQIAGKYRIKDKGHFVIVEQQQHTRWFFVPPKSRSNIQDGQYVTARVSQHPFESGKIQARIIHILDDEISVEMIRKYALAMFQLYEKFPKEALEQSRQIETKKLEDFDHNYRQDLRDLDFVTIDSASTKDMDDALNIVSTDSGWRLCVAIADPGSEILPNSPLDNIAQKRAQTLYLPGKPVPMLPEPLSQKRYSLVSGEDRRAMICEMNISRNGEVKQYLFVPAVIQSKAKLSYQQVTALLEEQAYYPPAQLDSALPFKDQLLALQQCAKSMKEFRQKNQLVSGGRDDFLLVLNEAGKLEKIEKLKTTAAHLIVEESMVATNQCAGQFLAENKAGIGTVNGGYRQERLQDIETLLKEWLGESAFSDSRKLDNFIAINHHLSKSPQTENALAIQKRFLQSSELSLEHSPHFGLGVRHYANITSPIRRYQDLVNQRFIHALLGGKTGKREVIKPRMIKRLNETLTNNRAAARFVQRWLIADYMQDRIGQTFQGYIALLTNQGIGIRLLDTGVEGFIPGGKQDKSKPDATFDKISFNNQRMELSWNGVALYYDQIVSVTLVAVDSDHKKLTFQWAEDPPKRCN